MLKSDMSETVIATCVVSAKRILCSFRPVIESKPYLHPIGRFQVDFLNFFYYILSWTTFKSPELLNYFLHLL